MISSKLFSLTNRYTLLVSLLGSNKLNFGLYLQKAESMLSSSILEEVKEAVRKQSCANGWFINKGGQQDLYYTVFGTFIAKALSLNEIIDRVSSEEINRVPSNDSVHLASQIVITHTIHQQVPKRIRDAFIEKTKDSERRQVAYTQFLEVLTFVYLKDYIRLFRTFRNASASESSTSPTLAIELLTAQDDKKKQIIDKLYQHYDKGGFKALVHSPQPDLLSTAVVVYALTLSKVDLRLVLPDILQFTTSLYQNGMYRSCRADFQPDIEYTFYGLLTLASINEQLLR